MGIVERLARWKARVDDELFLNQKEAVFRWVASRGNLESHESLVFDLDGLEVYGLKDGFWKKKRRDFESAFVVTLPRSLEQTLERLGEENIPEAWYPLFRSSILEVWETKKRHEEKGFLPLRFGLDKREREWILTETRRMVREGLEGRDPELPYDPTGRFSERQDLDVAVWVEGRVRASVIEIHKPCLEGLKKACLRVPQDLRFEPLTLSELPDARFEITFMSSLQIPLTTGEFDHDEIDLTKLYWGQFGARSGWYLPEVYNALAFSSLHHLLGSLAYEKIGLPREVPFSPVNFFQAEVFDWVETSSGTLSLSGSTPTLTKTDVSVPELEAGMAHIVESFLERQSESGSIPAILDFENGAWVEKQDLVRLACAGHSLAVYGDVFQNERATVGARKILGYVNRDLVRTERKNDLLTRIYIERLRRALGGSINRDVLKSIQVELSLERHSPILFLQGLTLLAESSEILEKETFAWVESKAREVYREFLALREEKKTQLATYPELIAALHQLHEVTGNTQWGEMQDEMMVWYRGKQLPNGAFPSVPGKQFAYTRGTGKIFEVLALDPAKNEQTLKNVWRWLETMRYTSESMFHIPPKIQPMFQDWYRHDAFYRGAWIDASAHILLGGTRWLNQLKQKNQ